MGDIRRDIEEAQRLLGPEKSSIAQSIATLRIEKRALETQLAVLRRDHRDLWRILVVMLAQLKEEGVDELRIHDTQFKRIEDAYRISNEYDKEAHEYVIKLKHFTDK